jgi:hypothetical protein
MDWLLGVKLGLKRVMRGQRRDGQQACARDPNRQFRSHRVSP